MIYQPSFIQYFPVQVYYLFSDMRDVVSISILMSMTLSMMTTASTPTMWDFVQAGFLCLDILFMLQARISFSTYRDCLPLIFEQSFASSITVTELDQKKKRIEAYDAEVLQKCLKNYMIYHYFCQYSFYLWSVCAGWILWHEPCWNALSLLALGTLIMQQLNLLFVFAWHCVKTDHHKWHKWTEREEWLLYRLSFYISVTSHPDF